MEGKPDAWRMATRTPRYTTSNGSALKLADGGPLGPDIVRGKHVLELGAGVGFLGILISKLQSGLDSDSINEKFSIMMSDVDDNVLERNKYNVSLPPSTSITTHRHKLTRLNNHITRRG